MLEGAVLPGAWMCILGLLATEVILFGTQKGQGVESKLAVLLWNVSREAIVLQGSFGMVHGLLHRLLGISVEFIAILIRCRLLINLNWVMIDPSRLHRL